MNMTVRLCSIKEMEIAVHPLVLVVLAGACVLGRLYDLLQAMLALTLHEAAHVVVAGVFGYRIRRVELQPFGGVARLSDQGLSLHGEWCIAAAGPVASFIIAGVASMVCYISPMTGARMEPFLAYNLALGVVNLLPALPLDGGRIVRCAIQARANASVALKLTAWAGVICGAIMLAAAVVGAMHDIYNLTLPVMGLFLLLAAIGELHTTQERRLTAMWQRNDTLRSGGGMDVHLMAAHASMEGMEALRLMRGNRFNLIRVVDSNMRTLGELDEGGLMLGLAKLGVKARVGDILEFDRNQSV